MKQNYHPNPTLSLLVGKKASRWLAYSLSLMIMFIAYGQSQAQTGYIGGLGSQFIDAFNSSGITTPNILVTQNSIYGIAVSPNGSKVYTTHHNSGNISVITTSNNSFVTVNVGPNPIGVAVSPDGSKVYVTNAGGAGTVSVINATNNTVTNTITVGSYAFGVAVSPDGSKVYVSNGSAGTVSVINAINNTVSATITVGTAPRGIAVSPDGSKVYVANTSSNSVSVINATDNTVSTTITAGTGPWGVAISPNGAKVYVSNNGSKIVSVINTADNAVSSINLGGIHNLFGISITPDGSKVYVTDEGNNKASVINTIDNSIGTPITGFNSTRSVGNYFPLVYPTPEINVTGNGNTIADNANAPTATDHTLFENTSVAIASSTRTYTIQNTGTGAMSVTNVAISGTDAGLFTVSGLPALPFNINASGSQTFTVTFAPTSIGTKDATVTITNNDADEASYDFAIRGVGVILNTYVSPTGSDANNGLTIGTPKLTIANAIATVEEGGTVNIATGTYPETVTITKNVTFATTGTVTIQNLTTNTAGKTLTLNSPLQVSRVVALQDGTIASNGNLVVASTATESGLIDNFTAGYVGTITGNIQVQRYLNNTNAGARIFSVPVSGMTASQLGSDVYTYNESIVTIGVNTGWQSIIGTTPLLPFRGYQVIQTATGNQTYTFTGTMHTGAYTAPLTRQVNTGSNPDAGFTAVGNPYPSPIDWRAVALLPANAGQITGVASIYKTTGLTTGVWATVNASGAGTNGATRWIPSGEGFLVRRSSAGSSTYNIVNSVRNNVYTNNNNFLREEEKTLIRLQLTNGTFADEALVYAEKEATGKIDIGLDAEKLAGDADKPYLSFVHNQQDWAITALPTLPTGLAMPIAIRGNGTYTLQVNEKTALNENLYLYDRKVGKLHDLSEGYTFQAVGAENNRFVLYVGKPSDEQLAQAGEAVRVWSYDKTIYLHFADADLAYQAQAQVLNVQGQKVLSRQAFQDANTQLQTTLPTGAYIVRVQTPQGVVTKKIVIE